MNFSALRSLLIYGICLPLALLIGYVLADPLKWSSFGTVGIVIFILCLPLLLRFHHPFLLLGWNLAMIVFFLPGSPGIWLPLTILSLTISVVRRAIDREFRFIFVPALTWPLVTLAAVVLATAAATGGIKFRSMGGEGSGGKNYVLLLGAILGYFALTAQRIPEKRARLYVALFLLSGITSAIGDVFYFQSSALKYLYAFFPPNVAAAESMAGISRLGGLTAASSVIAYFLLARYGVRGLFLTGKLWRPLLFITLAGASLLGGFRSALIALVLIFMVQFFLEGLHRTKLLPLLLLMGILGAAATLPFIEKLPYSVQRSLSFLPVQIDSIARMDAENSTKWRLELWESLLPQVPKYLFFG